MALSRRVFDEAMQDLSRLKLDAEFARWLLDRARKAAQTHAGSRSALAEAPTPDAALMHARLVLPFIRTLAPKSAERLLLRWVEGITGREQLEFDTAREAELRRDLEASTAAVIGNVFGERASLEGHEYLFSGVGDVAPSVARLELRLLPLRASFETSRGDSTAPPPTVTQSREATEQASLKMTAPQWVAPAAQGPQTGAEPKIWKPAQRPEAPAPLVPGPSINLPEGDALTGKRDEWDGDTDSTPAPANVPSEHFVADNTDATPASPNVPSEHFVAEDTNESTRIVAADAVARVRRASVSIPVPEREPDTNPAALDVARLRGASVLDPEDGTNRVTDPQGRTMKGSLPFVLAAVFLIASVGVAAGLDVLNRREVRRTWNLVPILVANREIPPGVPLSRDMLAVAEVPEKFVTSSTVTPSGAGSAVSQVVTSPLQRGDALMWTHLDGSRPIERLARFINPHARAVTLEAKKTTGVAGFIRPLDHVDVLLSAPKPGNEGEMQVVTLLQDVVVLATGSITALTNPYAIKPHELEYGDVSLLLLPEEVEAVILGREMGDLSLALRNDEDHATELAHASTERAALLTGQKNRATERKRFQTVEIIRAQPTDAR